MPRKHFIKSIFILKKITIQLYTYHVEYTQGTSNWSRISLTLISAMRSAIFNKGSAFFLINESHSAEAVVISFGPQGPPESTQNEKKKKEKKKKEVVVAAFNKYDNFTGL